MHSSTIWTRISISFALMFAVGSVAAQPEVWTNPSWPVQCGSSEKGDKYLVTKYLRFYPTPEQAKAQTPLDGNNILFGLRALEEMQVAYVAALDNDGSPKSVIAPYWVPTNQVDLVNFKLQQVRGNLWRYFQNSSPTDAGPIGKGIFAGADNYRCITEIGPTDGAYTLVHVQGYVFRTGDYADFFSPL